MKAIAYAEIGYTGQEVYRFDIPWKKKTAPSKEDIEVAAPFRSENKTAFVREQRGISYGDVKSVELEKSTLKIEVVPFTTRKGFSLSIEGKEIKDSEMEIKTRTGDDFASFEEGDVLYRLYTPKASGPRPMILFLHGGGNGGTRETRDNWLHIKVDYGCINFAEKYPDVYVLAPQCIERERKPGAAPINVTKQTFESAGEDQEYGWCRTYLAKVCDIIRRMVKEGKVDPKRIYVTGMSMGGGGTIRMMSVGSDLFAAAVPVCPTMTPETFNILRTMKAPVWVATAYIDHTVYRHKYCVDAIMEAKDNGNKNAHLTLYAPEELEKYDIAIDPTLSYKDKFQENHYSWVPTYNNEHGIMSWLLNQVKED